MNEQPNTTNKLVNGALAGAIVTVIVWASKAFAHVDIPTEVAMAISTIISLAAAHFTPVGQPKQEVL